jgi:arsenate reductase
MAKAKVLFVCRHNSARSQMAQEYLNRLAGDRFKAESAGVEPGTLNPLAVEVMREAGIDISHNTTRSVFDLYRAGKLFDFVITVCDEATAEQCPLFAGITKRLHWSFEDPSALEGTHQEKLEKVRRIRDAIRARIEKWLEESGED